MVENPKPNEGSILTEIWLEGFRNLTDRPLVNAFASRTGVGFIMGGLSAVALSLLVLPDSGSFDVVSASRTAHTFSIWGEQIAFGFKGAAVGAGMALTVSAAETGISLLQFRRKPLTSELIAQSLPVQPVELDPQSVS